MGMLERLSDARGTLEGKIVAVILAILLVLPAATVTAFANGDAEDTKDEPKTEEVVENKDDAGSVSVASFKEEDTEQNPTSVPVVTSDPEIYTINVVLEPGTVIVPTSMGMGMVESSQSVPATSNQDFKFEAFNSDYSLCTVIYNGNKLSPVSGNNYVIPQAELKNYAKIEVKKDVVSDPDEGKDPGTNPGDDEGNKPGQGSEAAEYSITARFNYVPDPNNETNNCWDETVSKFVPGQDKEWTIPFKYQASNPDNCMNKGAEPGKYFTGWDVDKGNLVGKFTSDVFTIPGNYFDRYGKDGAFELYPCYDDKPLTYTVRYNWEGADGLTNAASLTDMNGKEISREEIVLPEDNGAYEAGQTFKVDTRFNGNTQIMAKNNDGSVAIYRFSGWMRDDQVVTGAQTVDGNVVLKGVWTQLNYVPSIVAEDWTYDGSNADDRVKQWKTTITNGSHVDEVAPAKVVYFSKTYNEETGEFVVSAEPMPEAPKNAGHYVVQATWDDKFGGVVAQDEFVISPRPIVIQGISDDKPYDGSPLSTKDRSDYENCWYYGDPSRTPFVGEEGKDIKVEYTAELSEIAKIENSFNVVGDESILQNYEVKRLPGGLEIKSREDANKITLKLQTMSADKFYNGEEQKLHGLSNGIVVIDGKEQIVSLVENQAGNACTFEFNGQTYELSNYYTGASGKDVLKNQAGDVIGYKNVFGTSDGGEGFVIKENGRDVTSQFNKPIAEEEGILRIMPRPIVITTNGKAKDYDGTALVEEVLTINTSASTKTEKDYVLEKEAMVKTTGTITNVKWVDGKVSGVDNTYEINPIYVNGKTAFDKNNYDIKDELGMLMVYPRDISGLDFNIVKPADVDYNGKVHDPIPDVVDDNGSSLKPGDFTVAYSRDNDVNTRSYKERNDEELNLVDVAANANGEVYILVEGTGNYTGTKTTDFKINPAKVVIRVDSKAKKYGEDDPALTGNAFTMEPLEGDDDENWIENDKYIMRALCWNDRNNKRDTISSGDIPFYRNNLGENEDPRLTPVNVYENVLDVAKMNVNPNYELVRIVQGNLTVTDADAATISAEGSESEYDGQTHAIQVTIEDGWAIQYSLDGVNWSSNHPDLVNAGSYVVYAKATRPNYADTAAVSAVVTINPRPVTITVNDATKVAGTADPEFTGGVTEGSLVEGEDLGLSYSRTNSDEGIGTYENVLTAAYSNDDVAKNYAITIVNGDFTITPMAIPAVPPTPPTPGPLDTLVTTVTDFLATPIIGPGAVAAIGDEETPLAQIEDDGTPMSAFDHPFCWVHYYILLGIIITAIYGGGVIARRLGYNHKIKKYEDEILDKEKKARGKEKIPASNESAQPVV